MFPAFSSLREYNFRESLEKNRFPWGCSPKLVWGLQVLQSTQNPSLPEGPGVLCTRCSRARVWPSQSAWFALPSPGKT